MARPQSVLSEGTTVTGRIRGEGDLEIRGQVEGEVEVEGDLIVAAGALVRASLRGGSVVVRGALVGDVVASVAISLEATARVVGNLSAPRIAVALGAQVRGDLDMEGLDMRDTKGGEVRRSASASGARAPAVRASAPATGIRVPLPPARGVVVTRKVLVGSAAATDGKASAQTLPSGKREPPAPVVPAIKKGAKASPKRKGA